MLNLFDDRLPVPAGSYMSQFSQIYLLFPPVLYDPRHVLFLVWSAQNQNSRSQYFHSLSFVFMLRLFILLRNNYPRWQMGNSNRAVCSIDRLSTRATGSEYIYTQILVVDLYIYFFGFRGASRYSCRCVYSPARFGGGYTLNPVCTPDSNFNPSKY